MTMTDAETLGMLTEIFRDVFMRDDLELHAATTADDVEGWDSNAQIEVIMAVEERLGIKMTTRELDSLENVGNLVCPSSYDLGEDAKIVLLSTTEGEDKPLKYPSIFLKSELMLLTKIDLLPYVPFNADLAKENARRVHPQLEILDVSSTTDEGLDTWMAWLAARQRKAKEKSKLVSA